MRAVCSVLASLVKKPPGDGKKKKPSGGLERMEGGNRAGPPCRNFASGLCNGKCRFSHEEKASDGAEDGDDEEE